MILINLLPPELRKTRGGVDPVMLGAGAAAVAALGVVAFLLWVQFVRLPAARNELEARQAELQDKTAKAEEVKALEAQITDFEKHRDLIVGLLARKVYWARTVDDFANLLSGTWPGFTVCCPELTVQPALPTSGAAATRSKKDADQVEYAFRGRYKLIGEERAKAGDYVSAFLTGTEGSPFWRQNGFIDKPERSYAGDKPEWNPGINRVVDEISLEWHRVKTVVTTKPAAAKAAPAAPSATVPAPAAPVTSATTGAK